MFVTMAVLAWFYDQQLMLEGFFWSFLASLFARGMMKAWIPTLAGAAVYIAAFAYFHLNWPRSNPDRLWRVADRARAGAAKKSEKRAIELDEAKGRPCLNQARFFPTGPDA